MFCLEKRVEMVYDSHGFVISYLHVNESKWSTKYIFNCFNCFPVVNISLLCKLWQVI